MLSSQKKRGRYRNRKLSQRSAISRGLKRRRLNVEKLEWRHLLATVLGTGTGALLGGDLTDPENDGVDSTASNFNWVSTAASIENNFSPGGPSNEGALDVFDNKLSSGEGKWCCNSPTQWVAVEFDRPYTLTHFTLSSANDVPSRDPDVWEIQGSIDGANWETIYDYDNNGTAPFDQRFQVIRYDGGGADFATPDPYNWFRYHVTSTVGGGHQIGEIELFGFSGLHVASIDPSDGDILGAAPTTATVDFTLDFDSQSVDASDLTVDGIPATGVTVIDGDTLLFDLPQTSPGTHTIAIAEESILPAVPVSGVSAFDSTFIIADVPAVENIPATNILAATADLGISVIDTGGDAPDLFLHWGDNDGGTDTNNWDDVIEIGSGGVGNYLSGLEGLIDETEYFFRARGTNLAGASWAPSTSSFVTATLSAATVIGNPIVDVGPFIAEVTGEVLDAGGDNPTIAIYYGDEDGGTDINAWDHVLELGDGGETFADDIDGLSPETTYFTRIQATNLSGASWSPITRSFTTLPVPEVLINEFMAANASTLSTRTRASATDNFAGDQQFFDWIELRNPTGGEVNIGGTFLSDDINDPTRWQIPVGTTIPANGFLVVFASGLDITDASLDEQGFLHANFSLSSSGEFLGLSDGAGEPVHEISPQFPRQVDDVSYGIFDNQLRYMSTPTPNAPNVGDFIDFVGDTRFSYDRGFYTDAIDVAITTDTLGATIHFTLDGSPPSEVNGSAYSQPVPVSSTSTLRAIAFKPGLQSSNVDTHTYVYVDDVVTQTFQSTLDAGFPTDWRGTSPDYGLDSDVIGPNDLFGGKYAATIRDDLQSIPTLSIVTEIEGLFGDDGIYARPNDSNIEVPTSFELIYPDGTNGFQINAGVKIQGGAFRSFNLTKKKSLRLKFKSEYGPSTLNYPFFGADAVDEFDTITLRMEANDGWQWNGSTNRVYARDQFGRETQLAMGQPAAHGTRMHLYLNGVYWGVYNPVERPDETFASRYIGGEPEDWDVQNAGRAINGDLGSWNTLGSLANTVNTATDGSPEEIEAWQNMNGTFADGTNDPNQEDYLDVDNYADYMITNFYGGNSDWPRKNYYGGRLRGEQSPGYQFFMWDSEWSLDLNSHVNTNRVNESAGIAGPYSVLKNVEEFQVAFGDRVHKHFFNDGALYVDPDNPDWDPAHPERNVPAARFFNIIEGLRSPLVAESARWGDQHQNTPHTVDESWEPEVQDLLNNYFNRRSANVLQDFVEATLYPSVEAPLFNQRGGSISSSFGVGLTAPAGTIYYTLDGSDPRVVGGGISPTAIPFTNTFNLAENTTVRVRALSGSIWSAIDEALFIVDAVPATADNLRITEVNYNPMAGLPQFGEAPAGGDRLEFVELQNIGNETIDLSGAEFVESVVDGSNEGIRFNFESHRLEPGEYLVVTSDVSAFQSRYGSSINLANGSDDAGPISEYGGKLANGGERLTLLDAAGEVIQQFDFNDSSSWPGRADGNGSSLEIDDVSLDYNSGASWHSSIDVHGSPGAAGTVATPSVVINEVLTHTDLPAVDFIELHNVTADDIEIENWWLSDANSNYFKFNIPADAVVTGNGYLTFVETQFNDLNLDFPFALSGSDGDDVWLISGDETGSPLLFIDRIEFGAAVNGESIGRWPNGVGDVFPMTTVTENANNSGPRIGPIVVSEIMYSPLDPDGEGGVDPQDLEFVEIFNPTNDAVPLENWKLDSAVDFDFPSGQSIASNEAVVIITFDPDAVENVDRLAAFQSVYGIGNQVRLIGGYSGRLDNNGDNLELQRPDSPPIEDPLFIPALLEDQVRYDVAAPWPVTIPTGSSIVRVSPTAWGNDPTSWTATNASPGTYLDTALPTVLSFEINAGYTDPQDLPLGLQPTDWATQRSRLGRLDIEFSEVVALQASDIVLTNLGVVPDDVDEQISLANDQLEWIGSRLRIHLDTDDIEDGVYQLSLSGSLADLAGNPLDGDGDGNGGDDYVVTGSSANGFYRQVFDFNGDFGTSVFDFSTFSYWFGSPIPRAPEYADLNFDNGVSVFDFTFFANAFATGVTFDNGLQQVFVAPDSIESPIDETVELFVEQVVPLQRELAWRLPTGRRSIETNDGSGSDSLAEADAGGFWEFLESGDWSRELF